MAGPETGLFARAHGIGTHLLARQALEGLADATDPSAFARALARLGAAIEPAGDAPDASAIERAIRQTAARHLRTLGRWARREPGILDIVRGDLDRRSLRALIRGAAEGAPASARLAGLVPTSRLPERVLTTLAGLPSPRAVVARLAAFRDPAAALLAPHVSTAQPELFAIDAALLADWARCAIAVARTEGPVVREHVARRVDIGNAQVALLVAGSHAIPPPGLFVDGGLAITATGFAAATGATSPRASLDALRRITAGTWLGTVLTAAEPDVASVEREGLVRTMAHLQRLARVDPMSPAALLLTLSRIDAQTHDLRWLAWGAALRAPAALRRARLVTP